MFCVTPWCFATKDDRLLLFHVFHPDGEAWSALGIFHCTVILAAAIHRVHAPVEPHSLEAHLMDEQKKSTRQKK